MKGGESEFQVAGCRGAVGLGKNPFRGVDEDEAGGSAKQGIASAANIGGMTAYTPCFYMSRTVAARTFSTLRRPLITM